MQIAARKAINYDKIEVQCNIYRTSCLARSLDFERTVWIETDAGPNNNDTDVKACAKCILQTDKRFCKLALYAEKKYPT